MEWNLGSAAALPLARMLPGPFDQPSAYYVSAAWLPMCAEGAESDRR